MSTASTQSYGVANFATGTLTGAGAAYEVDCGFTPRWVKAFDSTNVIVWEWTNDMPATAAFKTVTAGTTTAETNSDIVANTDGFTLSATAAANAAAIHWVAMG